MAWTVGQEVGKESGYSHRLIFKGKVVKVTKGGRATVEFQRPDGGTFRSDYLENGRPYPYARALGSLFAWGSEPGHEDKWQIRLREHAAQQRRMKVANEEAARELAERREVIGWALHILGAHKDSRAAKAIALIDAALMPASDTEEHG